MITSTSNRRIKEARKLQRKRQRQASGQLLIEGVRLVGDALAAGVQPTLLFFDAEIAESNDEVAKLVARVAEATPDCEQIDCAPHVFAALADTVTPQGIAAVVPLPVVPLPDLPINSSTNSAEHPLVLVLDGVGDPGNAGTLLRTAEAAGVSLVLFGPKTVDPFNPKTVRAAMGAHFRLPLRSGDWSALRLQIEQMQPQRDSELDFALYIAEASAAQPYDAVDWCAPSVLVVGSEADGPSDAGRTLIENVTPVAIPMHGGTESLNVGIAGAIMLFEAARQRRIASAAEAASRPTAHSR